MLMRGIDTAGEANQTGTAPAQRLVRAAHEFEGQMMKELLKPMTAGDGLTGEDGDGDAESGSSGALGEYASEALGEALSVRGGFGVANRIVKELTHSSGQIKPGRQPEPTNTGMRAHE